MPGCDLPSASSGDISRDSLPEPVLEVTLKVGDVLFIPRGHIHEAVALSDGSSHVTVSTYQQWTWMQMATSVMKAWNVRTSTSQASSDGQHKHCAVMRRNGKCICTISRDCASEMLKLCHHNQVTPPSSQLFMASCEVSAESSTISIPLMTTLRPLAGR